jgi:autoinducer 2-degrading protein
MAFAITVSWHVKDGHEQEVEQILREMQEHSRREPGCLQYFAHRTDDPTRFLLYEQFVDAAAHETHHQTSHYRRLVTGRGVDLVHERVITRCETL